MERGISSHGMWSAYEYWMRNLKSSVLCIGCGADTVDHSTVVKRRLRGKTEQNVGVCFRVDPFNTIQGMMYVVGRNYG